jgi:hypothetical protein
MRRLALVAVLALLAAGCGGSSGKSSSQGGGSIPDGASQVSAKVQVFATLDSSFGDQWKAFNALVDRFPIRGQAIDSIHQSLAKDGVDFDKDIKATVGPEVDIASWNVGQHASSVVGLTKPKDKSGFEAALKKGSTPSVYYEDGDWVVFSDKQAALAGFKALGGGKLADDKAFQEGFHALSGTSLARVYVDATNLQQVVQTKLKSSAKGLGSLGSTGKTKVEWASAGVEALSDGFKVDSVLRTSGANIENYNASFDDVPAGAFIALAFNGKGSASLGSELRTLQQNAQTGATVSQFEAASGVAVEDVAKLFDGEGILYVRAGTPIPEVTLIESGGDAKRSVKTLTTIGTHLAALTGAPPKQVSVGGKSVWQISVRGFSLYYGDVGGKLVVTTAQTGITDLGGGGGKLSDTDNFKNAAKAAGISTDDTAGLVYVDLQSAMSTLTGLAALGGQKVPASTDANLANLRGLLLGAHADDSNTTRVTVFVGVAPGKPVPATHATTTTATT